MRVEATDGRSIVYGADLGTLNGVIEFAARTDLLISEATADDNSKLSQDQRGHLTPEDAGRWARLSGARRLLLTHLWCERPSWEVAARAASEFPGPIDVASRGQTLYVS
jgi:ribonuclease BN (tRNA processing enzyme)